jgi:uncharacterized phiE125 gp8 family phage protein
MLLEIGTPSVEPITLEEAKAHLRVTSDDEDDYIQSLIPVAREWGETFQGRSWITRSIDYFIDAWPQSPVQLPRPPIQEITSVKYATDDGEYTLAQDEYMLDPLGRLHIYKPPPDGDVRYMKITYKAGYGDDPASLPHRVKQAMLLLIGHWYENREIISDKPTNDIPYTAELLLLQERIIPI